MLFLFWLLISDVFTLYRYRTNGPLCHLKIDNSVYRESLTVEGVDTYFALEGEQGGDLTCGNSTFGNSTFGNSTFGNSTFGKVDYFNYDYLWGPLISSVNEGDKLLKLDSYTELANLNYSGLVGDRLNIITSVSFTSEAEIVVLVGDMELDRGVMRMYSSLLGVNILNNNVKIRLLAKGDRVCNCVTMGNGYRNHLFFSYYVERNDRALVRRELHPARLDRRILSRAFLLA